MPRNPIRANKQTTAQGLYTRSRRSVAASDAGPELEEARAGIEQGVEAPPEEAVAAEDERMDQD